MNTNEIDDKALDLLSSISWGLDFSHYKRVVSGNTIEDYEYERSVHFGGSLSRYKRVGKRNSTVRRSFSISRARLKIRRLIASNSNFWGYRDIFITFTFAENITKLKIANSMWTSFIKRLNYDLGFSVKYVAVVEFQKRGAVHYHAVFFNIPYIMGIKERFSSIWSYGFIKINSVKKISSIGAYLSKYLQKGVVDKRLFNEKCYFTSRGLNKPFVTRYPPVDLDFVSDESILILQEQFESESKWTGRIVYKRYQRIN